MKYVVALLTLLLATSTVSADESQTEIDQRAIRTLFDQYSAAIAARNLNRIMALYANDVVVFDAFPPRKYVGVAAYRKDYEDFFAAYPGPINSQVSDLTVTVVGSIAYAYGIDHWTVTDVQKKATDMTFRFTDVLRKKRGIWLIVHEHVSFPVNPATGTADFASKP